MESYVPEQITLFFHHRKAVEKILLVTQKAARHQDAKCERRRDRTFLEIFHSFFSIFEHRSAIAGD